MKIVLFFLLIGISACANHGAVNYDATVIPGYQGSASHIYSSITDAIASAPTNNQSVYHKNSQHKNPYRIYISPGDYYEKITLDRPNVHLVGAGRDKSRIYFDAYAGQEFSPGQTWGTRGSATVTIRAPDVHLYHLTIENSFDFLGNDDPKKIRHAQAVALVLDEGSDRIVGRDLALLGYQDTLFVDAGRSWFDQSLIAGNVDFIFGAGNAVFTESEIRTLGRGRIQHPIGYITAPSTQIANQFGLTFIRCQLTRVADVPDGSTYLGRPWHPTTQFADGRYADPDAIGKAVFIDTFMDAHIADDGWHSMGGTAKDGSRIEFLPEDARFFEHASQGPGAKINAQRRQLNSEEATGYRLDFLLGNWHSGR